MSSVDNRVVKMTFDNEQFERGVSKSMSTLDKLEEKLQFKKAATGLQSLQVAINGVAFDRFATAIEGIEKKLSGVGVAAATVVSRITNSLIDGAIKIERATIGQIQSGGWARAMKLENAKFTVEGLKLDWTEMLKAINYGVQDTAYGLDAAASAASQLAASGVSYKESIEGANDSLMHRSLRAISGVAAMTNSSYEEISRIFAAAAGQGGVMGEQLQQLASRGLNAAAVLAEAFGTTEDVIRDAASKRQISFQEFADAMDNAFGEHAKEANKTFNGALSNMKAALSRFGAVFATPVIQKTNTFFIALTDRIKEMKNAISDVKLESGELEKHLEGHFADMWEELITLADVLVHKIDLTWFWEIADAADAVVVKITNMLATLNDLFYKEAEGTSETVKKVYDLSAITEEELKVAQDVINGNYGNGQQRIKALSAEAEKLGIDPEKIQEYVNAVSKYGYSFDKAGIKVAKAGDAVEETEDIVNTLEKTIDQSRRNLVIAFHNFQNASQDIRTNLNLIIGAVLNGFHAVKGEANPITSAIRAFSFESTQIAKKLRPTNDELEVLAEAVENVVYIFSIGGKIINYFVTTMYDLIKTVFLDLKENGVLLVLVYDAFVSIRSIATSFYQGFRNIIDVISEFAITLYDAVVSFIGENYEVSILSVFEEFASGFFRVTQALQPTEDDIVTFTYVVTTLCEILLDAYSIFKTIISVVSEFAISLFKEYKAAGVLSNIVISVTNTFKNLYRTIRAIGKIASGIFRAVAVAFFRVFRPDMAISYVDLFTAGIADLFEMLEPTEGFINGLSNVLYVVFTAVDYAIEVVLKLITTISSMFTTMNNKKKAADGVEDTVEGISDTASGAVGIIELLAGVIMGFIDYLSKIPQKLSDFADAVSQEEGVIRLKTAVENLWKSMKDSVKTGIDPFKKALEDIGNSAGFEITIDDVTESIGWIADKIAWLIEKLPEWYDAVVKFFSDTKDQIVKFFDDTGEVIGVSDIKQTLEEGFDGDDKTLFDKVKGLVLKVGDWIFKTLEEIDWNKVGDTSLLLGALAMIWQFIKFGESLTNLVNSIKDVPKALSKLLGGFNNFLSTATTTMATFSKLALIGMVAASVVAITMSIAVLASIPEYDLTKAASIVVVVLAFMLAITKVIAGIINSVSAKQIAEFQSIIANASNAIGLAKLSLLKAVTDALGLAVVIITIAGALYIIAKTIIMVAEWMEHVEEVGGSIGGSIIVVVGIFAALLLIAGIIFALMKGIEKKLRKAPDFKKALASWQSAFQGMLGLSAIMLSFGASLYLVAKAFQIIEGIWVDGDDLLVIGLMALIITVLAASSALLVKALNKANLDWRTLLGFAAMLFVFSLALVVILAEVVGIAFMFKAADIAGMKEDLIFGFGAMALLLLTLGACINLIGKVFQTGMTTKINVGAMTVALLGMIAIIFVLGVAVTMITQSFETFDDDGVKLGFMLSIVAIIGVLYLFIHELTKKATGMTDDQVKRLTGIAGVALVIAGAVLIMSLGISVMAVAIGDMDWKTATAMMSGMVILFAALIGATIGLVAYIKKTKGFPYKGLHDVAMGVLMLAASMVVIALAIHAMALTKDVWGDPKAILPIIGCVSLVILMMAALGAIANKLGGGGVKGAEFLAKVGLAMVIFSAGLVVLAVALNMIQGLSWTTIAAFAGAMFVLFGALAAVLAITKNSTTSLQTLLGIAAVVVSFGASAILMGAALTLVKAALIAIMPLLPILLVHMGTFFKILTDNWGVFLTLAVIIGIIVLAVGILVVKTLPTVMELAQAVATVIKSVGDIIVGVVGAIAHKSEETTNKMGPKLRMALGTALLSMASAVTDKGPEVLKKFGSLLFLFIDWLIAMTPAIAGKLCDWLITLLDALSVQIDMRANRIAASIENIIGSIKDVLIKILAGAMSDIAEWFSQTTVGQWLNKGYELAGLGSDVLGAGANDMRDWAERTIKENAEGRRQRMEDAIAADKELQGLADQYEEQRKQIVGTVSDAESWSLFGSSSSTSEGGGMFGKIKSFVSQFIGGGSSISGGLDGLTSKVFNLSNGVDVLVEKVEGFPQAQQDVMINAGAAFRNEAGEFFTIKNVSNGSEDFAGGLISDFSSYLGEDGELFNMMSMEGFGLGDTLGANMTDGQLFAMENGTEDIYAAVDDNMKTMGDAVDDNKEYLYDKSRELTAQSAEGIKDVNGKYAENQANNLAGIIRATREMAREGGPIDEATKYLCDQMHTYFERYNEIQSPSKLYYRTTGYIGQAIVNSINDATPSAEMSMTELSNSMINSFTNPLDYVARVASGELTYDPSIRPVLDTSNIATGAYGIRSMFDNQNVSLSGFSGKLAADITGLDTTNTQVVTELKALRSDMNMMTDQIAGMQIIMDSGQLVGAIAPGMDDALGRRAIHRGRGN